MTETEKEYIGDGVYLEFERYGELVLTTENGLQVTNRIVLEPQVWEALLLLVDAHNKRLRRGVGQ